MYPRANQFPQSISLTTKKCSAQEMVAPTWVRNAPSHSSFLQAVGGIWADVLIQGGVISAK